MKNYLFCIDLQTLLLSDPLVLKGKEYHGILKCMDDSPYGDEYVFEETLAKKVPTSWRRNPLIFQGGAVNVHSLADGSKRPEFVRPKYRPGYGFRDFCLEAIQDLALAAELFKEEDV